MHVGETIGRLVAVAVAGLVLVACAGMDIDPTYQKKEGQGVDPNPSVERQTVFGPGGLNNIFGGGDKPVRGEGGGGIGVNSFLWRAALDTVAFMPLNSADPFGGVIITDWFSPEETPNERFKMTIYILDYRLRADGIKVAVFRQLRTRVNGWDDSTVNSQTAIDLENAILTRARQMRMDNVQ